MTDLVSSFRYREAADGCWLWQGYCDSNGYGRIYDRERKSIVWAHRFSYERHKGPIPERHEIDHTCQTTACVNPDHLDAVTKAEHARRTMMRLGKDDLHVAAARLRRSGLAYGEIADALGYAGRGSAKAAVIAAIVKGLIAAEEVPPARRLSDAECDDIRAMYALGVPQTVLARHYGFDSSHISRVCSNQRLRKERRRRPLEGAA